MGSQLGALFGGLTGDAGKNFVDLQGGAKKVFGEKPRVADYVATDLPAEQKKTVDANLAAMPDIDKLLDSIMPGYTDMLAQGSKNTLSLLKGELPDDVKSQVMRSDAFQSLMGGFGNSGMSRSLTARDLGRTSLDMMQIGENSMQKWTALAHGNASPMLINPAQQSEMTMRNNLYKQSTQQFKYNVEASPDPGAAGIFNLDAALGQQMLQLGGAMGGAAMAGGGGGGGAAKGAGAGAGGWAQQYGQYAQAAQAMFGNGSGGNWQQNATWGSGNQNTPWGGGG